MSYFLCAAGVTLRNQINRRYKNRDKRSDGWIGNASHQAVPSDHNPDWSAGGVVRAIDIDADLMPKVGNHKAAETLAEELRQLARTHERTRISYIIFQKRIASEREIFAWRPYSGINAHDHHIHVSFKPSGDKNGNKFNVPSLKTPVLSR
jgi:hypothetical protein